MVVGGFHYDEPETFGYSQFFDLTAGFASDCPNVPKFMADYGSTGTFINGKALVCGGTIEEPQYRELSSCYSYTDQVKDKNIHISQ